jgi:hypothetical protein
MAVLYCRWLGESMLGRIRNMRGDYGPSTKVLHPRIAAALQLALGSREIGSILLSKLKDRHHSL